ncbi:MAG: hypothetical protein ACOCQU_03665 [Halolamina sp.]
MHRGRTQTATGDLLLVASLVTLVPSWIGGVEVLSALGIGHLPAVLVGGTYAWGRGALSAGILLRRWRTGSLTLGGSWLASSLETVAARSRMADLPTPPITDGSFAADAPAAA